MKRHLANLRAAFGQVFAYPSYLALAGVLATGAFLLAVWFPNLGLIVEVFSGSNAPLAAKLGIALSLLGGIGTNFSLLSAGYTVAIAVLFGVTAAMIAYLLKQRQVAAAGQNIAIGSGGVASGVVGIGCAACGSLILGSVLPSLGAAGALAALPLNGEEFGILSVALLFVSLLLVSKNIAEPAACPLARDTNAQQP
ncbi:MAG: hypothetical protein HYU76_15105 [Betaproteobacteria bacterium]|nr:hypothetical protein [Betaproteobacteria bacterium]